MPSAKFKPQQTKEPSSNFREMKAKLRQSKSTPEKKLSERHPEKRGSECKQITSSVRIRRSLPHIHPPAAGAEPAGLEEKARRLLCQCIDELIYYEGTHIILATQEQYVLLLLDDSHQFRISRVYTILGSSITQARDMAELVLFYTHALLTRRPRYPPSRPPSVSVYRVTVPAFSPRLFQPHEALLCNGRLMHRAKLSILPRMPGKPIPRPFSVQFHTSHASCRHEGDIVVSFGRLIFFLFDTHIVAKAAYQSSALDRLQHEFTVYEILRTLRGVVIPSLFGMYRNLSDGSSMLVASYAGVTLEDFVTLCLKDRYVAMRLYTTSSIGVGWFLMVVNETKNYVNWLASWVWISESNSRGPNSRAQHYPGF
ncbi:hypothetical protein C8R44DRAFT_725575 [Mycena epipterygia]|nr:hypothetical protein C8R44DRAFT_725575 [Mycena epipterygia]